MAFSLSGAFSGALGGAGTGSMFGGPGAAIGAGIGALTGGFMQSKPTNYGMSDEQKALYQNELDIASGKKEAPEVTALKAQSEANMQAQIGAQQANRGASQGAKSAYLAGLGMQNQATTNAQAATQAAQSRQIASQNAANMAARQQGYDIASQQEKAQRKSNFLGAMTQLGAWGASQYMNQNKTGTEDWTSALGGNEGGNYGMNQAYNNAMGTRRYSSSPYVNKGLQSSWGLNNG